MSDQTIKKFEDDLKAYQKIHSLENRELHEVFEYYCADEILPKLEPQHQFPDFKFIDQILTPYQDGGHDIRFENIVGECKYKYIDNDIMSRAKDKLLKLAKEIQKERNFKYQITIYLFCKDTTSQVKKDFEEETKKSEFKFYLITHKQILEILQTKDTNATINLEIELSYDPTQHEKRPYLCNLFQGDKQDEDSKLKNVFIALVGISGWNFIEALKKKFKPNLEDVETIYADNIRGFLGKKGNNKLIYKTIDIEPEKFCIRNNGICLAASFYEPVVKEEKFIFNIEGVQVINGAQTIGCIIKFYLDNKDNAEKLDNLKKVRIPVKIISGKEICGEKIKEDLKVEIIKYHNKQTSTTDIDFCSNDPLQKNIHEQLRKFRVNYRIRRSDDPRRRNSIKNKDKTRTKTIDYDCNIQPYQLYQVIMSTNLKKYLSGEYGLDMKLFVSQRDVWKKKYYPKYFKDISLNRWSNEYAKSIAFYCHIYSSIKTNEIVKAGYKDLRLIILKLYSLYYESNCPANEKYQLTHLKDEKYKLNFVKDALELFFKNIIENYKTSSTTSSFYSYLKRYIENLGTTSNPIINNPFISQMQNFQYITTLAHKHVSKDKAIIN